MFPRGKPEARMRRIWAGMQRRKGRGEFQAGPTFFFSRIEMTGRTRAGREQNTHSQGLERYVHPSDGLRCLRVIPRKVGDDAARRGGYQPGRGHLERGVLRLAGKSQCAEPRRKGGGRRLNMKSKEGELGHRSQVGQARSHVGAPRATA